MNTNILTKFDYEKSTLYTKFMNLGGIRSLPKDYNEIKKFLNEKDNDYLEGLKMELENSFFNKYLIYPRTYSFVSKKLEEAKEHGKNLTDIFSNLSSMK